MDKQLNEMAVPKPNLAPRLTLEELRQRADELRHICDHLDPFAPLEEDMKVTLGRYHITEHFDPFAITNKLILLLEDTLEEIQKRGHEV